MIPLVAILRDMTPSEAVKTANQLLNAGIRQIEIPQSTTDAVVIAGTLLQALGPRVKITLGTVIDLEGVQQAQSSGCHAISLPRVRPQVISAAKAAGLSVMAGVLTPAEGTVAIKSGADKLKLYPAFLAGAEGMRSLRRLLPDHAVIYAAGGVEYDEYGYWLEAGANGFCLDIKLLTEGSERDTYVIAKAIVEEFQRCRDLLPGHGAAQEKVGAS